MEAPHLACSEPVFPVAAPTTRQPNLFIGVNQTWVVRQTYYQAFDRSREFRGVRRTS
jgi:hypothetical protein